MSTFRLCCCSSCSDRNEQKLPLYLTPYQKGPLQFESLTRHQKTILRVEELTRKRNDTQRTKDLKFLSDDKTGILLSKVYLWSLKQHSIQETHDSTTNVDEGKNIKQDVSAMNIDALMHDVTHYTTKAPTPKPDLLSMEGPLLKFTNLIKGYQNRWVVLNGNAGSLEYFEKKEHRKLKPRGSIGLKTAKVSKSQIDPHIFIVTAANGETFKLKATDDNERLHWVERISAIAEHYTEQLEEPPLFCPTNSAVLHVCGSDWSRKAKKGPATANASKKPDTLLIAKEYCREAEDYCRHLDNSILGLPSAGVCINPLDTDLLLLKATSSATIQCIQDCITFLQIAKIQLTQCTSPNSSFVLRSSFNEPSTLYIFEESGSVLPNPEDEIPDETSTEDNNLEKMDDQKSVILHLLSQLRIGMDLTKVTLPTFILERRSLLELFTDCMAHPDVFVNIPKIGDSQSRFLATLEWYLTSFHSGRLGTSTKKPYNPILGETFHCSWRVPDFSKDILMTYTAEQVSHHPPVSAFYVECLQNNIKMNSSIHTKSKFMGMSIGVSMVGTVHLRLEDHNEEYVFTLPSVYARSILTVPWVELGDKLQLTCEKTGYVANITFHTKPFYGGKLHHVTAEAKNVKTGDVVCRVSGHWDTMFEFTYPEPGNKHRRLSKETRSKVVDLNTLKVCRKYIRPLDKQKDYESRKLWYNVSTALLDNDIHKATEYKQKLETIQRDKEESQTTLNIEYEAKFFKKVNGVWLYKTLPEDFAAEKQRKS